MTTLENILTCLKMATLEGTTGLALEEMAGHLLKLHECEPAFVGYQPQGFKNAYPNILCVSINGEVIHGIPDGRQFKNGDVVKIDIGIKMPNGQFDDGAVTVIIGKGSSAARRLVTATQEALEAGIEAAIPGNTTEDIAIAIEDIAKREGFSVVHGYGGHGIGDELHMEPFIPNEAGRHLPVTLEKGMRIAIEPMFSSAKGATVIGSDGWLIKLAGGGVASHCEKTIVVGE